MRSILRMTARFGVIPALLALPFGAALGTTDTLEASFRRPPAGAKPHTWWHWLNGNTSKEGITADLEAMKRAGIGGVQIFNVDCGIPDGPIPVMSPQWQEHTRHAIAEAARLGLEVCIHNCPGWSSSGGPWVTPEHAMQMLTWTERDVEGPGRISIRLDQPATRQGYYRDIAVIAMPIPAEPTAAAYRIRHAHAKAGFDRPPMRDPDIVADAPPGAPLSEIREITGHMKPDGSLAWDAPPGRWTLIRIGHTCTGAQNAPAPVTGRGLEVDKLSRPAMDAFWTGFMGRVIEAAGPNVARVLNNALIDSYETGYQNWTPAFREEFARRRGYDLIRYIPALTGRVVANIDVTERFLWDFRRTVSDLWAENYYAYFAELCRRNGLLFSTEPYGNGTFDNLQAGGIADIPMGEFWVPNGGAGQTLKLAAAAAHTNGRRIVGAESFTADEARGRWLVEPYGIKALGDYVFTQGINRYIFHRYAHQPWLDLYPGMTMGPWGTHLERTITWWDQASAWFTYIARCQFLLQSGLFTADVCYFVGEAGPNDLPERAGLHPTLPTGYDYDGCDATVLLNRMVVRNGRIVLPDGMSYRLLVLPDSRYMSPAIARKIQELVRDGAYVVGPRPERSPGLTGYPDSDREVDAIGAAVWADCDGVKVKERAYGKGRVFWGLPMSEILRRLNLKPDFEYRAARHGARLAYIHRRIGAVEVYFVSNQEYRSIDVDCQFRVSGKTPELWHADTGKIETAPVWRDEPPRTLVSLRLEPAESVFVIFRKPAAKDHLVLATRAGASGKPLPKETIVIRSARYEAQDGSRGADVTARVAELIAQGYREVQASNEIFGDPVPNVVKRLRVEWTLNGAVRSATEPEGGTIVLGPGSRTAAPRDWQLDVDRSGRTTILLWKRGQYTFRTRSGKSRTVIAQKDADAMTVRGPWTVRFKPGWGAPERATFPKLVSWTARPEEGIRYFSGWAAYSRTLTVSREFAGQRRRIELDLGQVKNFAEVTLNGRYLGILWKAPYRLDVTGLLKPGVNRIEIKVTNLWPNRLIGDERKPADVEWRGTALAAWPAWVWSDEPRPARNRKTFTTWRFWSKDDEPIESGLLGPVTLRSSRPIPIL